MTTKGRKFQYFTWYLIRVDGRLFEETKSIDRANEVAEILASTWTNADISIEVKKRREYL